MPIVSSTFKIDGHAQEDGRSYVREEHTDSTGAVHLVEYLASPGTNHQAVADARAVAISDALATAEFEATVNG